MIPRTRRRAGDALVPFARHTSSVAPAGWRAAALHRLWTARRKIALVERREPRKTPRLRGTSTIPAGHRYPRRRTGGRRRGCVVQLARFSARMPDSHAARRPAPPCPGNPAPPPRELAARKAAAQRGRRQASAPSKSRGGPRIHAPECVSCTPADIRPCGHLTHRRRPFVSAAGRACTRIIFPRNLPEPHAHLANVLQAPCTPPPGTGAPPRGGPEIARSELQSCGALAASPLRPALSLRSLCAGHRHQASHGAHVRRSRNAPATLPRTPSEGDAHGHLPQPRNGP